MICGSGAAGCEVETDCSGATIRSLSEDFCIYDDFGIITSVSNHFRLFELLECKLNKNYI